jgi:hypothetical protein
MLPVLFQSPTYGNFSTFEVLQVVPLTDYTVHIAASASAFILVKLTKSKVHLKEKTFCFPLFYHGASSRRLTNGCL